MPREIFPERFKSPCLWILESTSFPFQLFLSLFLRDTAKFRDASEVESAHLAVRDGEGVGNVVGVFRLDVLEDDALLEDVGFLDHVLSVNLRDFLHRHETVAVRFVEHYERRDVLVMERPNALHEIVIDPVQLLNQRGEVVVVHAFHLRVYDGAERLAHVQHLRNYLLSGKHLTRKTLVELGHFNGHELVAAFLVKGAVLQGDIALAQPLVVVNGCVINLNGLRRVLQEKVFVYAFERAVNRLTHHVEEVALWHFVLEDGSSVLSRAGAHFSHYLFGVVLEVCVVGHIDLHLTLATHPFGCFAKLLLAHKAGIVHFAAHLLDYDEIGCDIRSGVLREEPVGKSHRANDPPAMQGKELSQLAVCLVECSRRGEEHHHPAGTQL